MIKVFFYNLDKEGLAANWDRCLAQLPEWRRESCLRMKFEQGRLQQLAAGLLLRLALREEGVDLMTADITKNEHGKPMMEGLYFNISHSGDYIAVAIADYPVGIDVEIKTDPDLKITERFYSEEEQRAVRDAEDPQKEFRRLWTRKEAYVKCTGTGIYDSVAKIPSLVERSGDYRIFTLQEEEEYTLSLAVRCGADAGRIEISHETVGLPLSFP
jgi:4'-phosphopantetheinyl transferase